MPSTTSDKKAGLTYFLAKTISTVLPAGSIVSSDNLFHVPQYSVKIYKINKTASVSSTLAEQ